VNTNQQIEMRLIETYDDELEDFLQQLLDAARSDQESLHRYFEKFQRKIDIFEKQVLNYKQIFPGEDIRFYESRIYYFRGVYKLLSAGFASGSNIFSSGKLIAATKLFDTALQISEQISTRRMKVLCYRQLKDKKSALQEINYILEHYKDDEEVYLEARKEKDEIGTFTPKAGL
jgi:tetratricopeptide (TPR) repeat protein